MYIRRKIDKTLAEWKSDPDRLPLVVKGPRQVGKTESIQHFARDVYNDIITINFVEQPKFKTICSDGYDPASILRNITLLDPAAHITEGSTLLFFDELQDYPEIATALKFLAHDPRFDVICSGSMLGLNYGKIESNSVGYKTDVEMRSLDFEEFLHAIGYGEDTTERILEHMVDCLPFSAAQTQAFSSAFMDYCILGGMPAVISRYLDRGTFESALTIQRQLLADYREDVQKYAEGLDKARILNVFDHIPTQLAKENKKLQISKVANGARFKDYRGCVEWLETAGMVNVCRCMSFPELPVKGNYDGDKCKLYYGDTGFLVAMLDDEASEDLRANKNLGVYKGALYENIMAEALAKQGMPLVYYKKEDSTLEIDFLARTADELVPIEVKARDGRAKSMRTLIDSDKYPDVSFGVKFTAGNVGRENGILTFPHFCAFQLRRLLRDLPRP